MDEAQTAVNALEQLGLTEYEARCFVALTRIPHGTAKEVGKVADIPRSRVYETVEQLQKKGLVAMQDGEPRTFQSVSIDSAIRMLREEYETYFETIEDSLRQLEPAYKETQQAVWAISNHEQVTGRVIDIIDDAEEEIVLILLEEGLLDEDVIASLAEADARGATIHIGTVADAVHERVDDADIEATLFTTGLIEWFTSMSGSPQIGRLLMADRGPVLVSATHDEQLPGVVNETAAWSDGIDHGFATFTERVLTYELRQNVREVYEQTDSE